MGLKLTDAQIERLAESLRETLAACESGELVASTQMIHRLEGAIAALESALGRLSSFNTLPAQ